MMIIPYRVHIYDRYYDLIEVPHGHIPAPLLFPLYRFIPLREGEPRDESFFSCPICGAASFFSGVCSFCEEELSDPELRKYEVHEGIRHLLKSIEHLFIPVLWLFGAVKYNKVVEDDIP